MAGVGKVDGAITPERAKELAQICALNCLAAVETVADVNNITKIVRVVGYVNGVPGFVGHPGVVNGASELFIAIWGDGAKHARSAVGIAETSTELTCGDRTNSRNYRLTIFRALIGVQSL
jgi:enamine deaminase RidA (YjgF/YER057c/UK114 family)